MRRVAFRMAGARQATKTDLIDILEAVSRSFDAGDRNDARWTVDSLRHAISFALEQLAEVKADRDDYEQRWLAECRAHGETRRALEARLALPRSCGFLSCEPVETAPPGASLHAQAVTFGKP